jgi:hypothetical protein
VTRSSAIGRRVIGVAATLAVIGAMPAPTALAQDGACQQLQKTYQQELQSAQSLKSKAAQQAMQSGSQALSKLGINPGSTSDAQQAIQKGALAATSPQMQGAIIIQILSANTHLQEMIWRGCKSSAG